jgi:hypothetical protein
MDNPALDAAYRATTYAVAMPDGTTLALRVGECSAPLDRFLAAAGHDRWAFLTACNPRSSRLDDEHNTERMARLADVVQARGLRAIPGEGRGDGGDWPAEPSLLVLGVEEPQAVEIGRMFDQHAIVVGSRGSPPRLAWISGG